MSSPNPKFQAKRYRPWDIDGDKTDSKPTANRQQTDSKPTANREQTDSDRLANRQRLVSKPTAEPLANRQQLNRQQTDSKPTAIGLVGNEKTILFYLFEICRNLGVKVTPPITLDHVGTDTGIGTNTAKNALYRLSTEKNIIVRDSFKNGRGGWSRFSFRDDIFSELTELSKPTANRQQTVSKPLAEPTAIVPYSSSLNNIDNNQTTITGDWLEIDFSELEFNGVPIGFCRNHVKQIAIRGKLSAEELQDSINHYAYELKNKPPPVENKLRFFLGSVLKGAVWGRPSGYISPQESLLLELREQKQAEAERIRKLQNDIREDEFIIWEAGISESEKAKILKFSPSGDSPTSEKFWSEILKSYFLENVFNLKSS